MFRPFTSCVPAIAAALLLISGVSRAEAQTEEGWFRYRAVALTPGIAINNFGHDGNVFNDPDHPRGDISATVQPSVHASLRLGRSVVSWSGRADALVFKKYHDQGTLGTSQTVRLDTPLARLRFFTGYTYVNARERPTIDIDVRARRHEHLSTAGATYQLGALTSVGATIDLGQVAFARNAITDDGLPLGFVLDRSSTHVGVTVQRAVTSLTSLVGSVDWHRDAFTTGTARHTVQRRAAAGLAFKPVALLTGGISVGVLSVLAADERVPPKQSPAVSADLGYTLLGYTHFSFRADRSVSYSLEDPLSYSLQSGLGGSVTRHLGDAIAVTGSLTRQQLAYQLTAAGLARDGGLSHLAPSAVVSTYDSALSYQLISGIHIGLHVAYSTRRTSGATTIAGYNNLAVFSSVSYVPRH